MTMEPLTPVEAGVGPRSPGLSYQDLLDADTRPVPDVLRMQAACELPAVRVPIERYTSQAFHDLEVEKIWKKVWQFACREDDIPNPGDHEVYDVADVSILLVRGQDRRVRAFYNTCLHRGRALKDQCGHSETLRCPFHGWTWNLDGSLKEIPCRWDFPHVQREEYALEEVKVGTWGGFVFINMDSECEPLENFLGELPQHFTRWPLEKRFKEAHISKVMPCNWKANQEAFMEAYHVVATHPQLLPGIGDANTQYDAWGTFSRAMTPNMTPSPHLLDEEVSEQAQLNSMLSASLDGEPPMRVPKGMSARAFLGQLTRMQLQSAVPSVGQLSDAELADSFYYSVFPNFHPWGAYNRIVYRFRPWENRADRAVMDVLYLSPYRGRKPADAKVHWLDIDEPWTNATELGSLANVFAQDSFNLGRVQDGLRSAHHTHVTFANYQETKIRHFHALLEKYINA